MVFYPKITFVVLRCSIVWEWALRMWNRRAALGSGVALAAHVALSKGARRQVSQSHSILLTPRRAKYSSEVVSINVSILI